MLVLYHTGVFIRLFTAPRDYKSQQVEQGKDTEGCSSHMQQPLLTILCCNAGSAPANAEYSPPPQPPRSTVTAAAPDVQNRSRIPGAWRDCGRRSEWVRVRMRSAHRWRTRLARDGGSWKTEGGGFTCGEHLLLYMLHKCAAVLTCYLGEEGRNVTRRIYWVTPHYQV